MNKLYVLVAVAACGGSSLKPAPPPEPTPPAAAPPAEKAAPPAPVDGPDRAALVKSLRDAVAASAATGCPGSDALRAILEPPADSALDRCLVLANDQIDNAIRDHSSQPWSARKLDDKASTTPEVTALLAACAEVPAKLAASHQDGACSPFRVGIAIPANVMTPIRLVRAAALLARAKARSGDLAGGAGILFDAMRLAQDAARGAGADYTYSNAVARAIAADQIAMIATAKKAPLDKLAARAKAIAATEPNLADLLRAERLAYPLYAFAGKLDGYTPPSGWTRDADTTPFADANAAAGAYESWDATNSVLAEAAAEADAHGPLAALAVLDRIAHAAPAHAPTTWAERREILRGTTASGFAEVLRKIEISQGASARLAYALAIRASKGCPKPEDLHDVVAAPGSELVRIDREPKAMIVGIPTALGDAPIQVRVPCR